MLNIKRVLDDFATNLEIMSDKPVKKHRKSGDNGVDIVGFDEENDFVGVDEVTGRSRLPPPPPPPPHSGGQEKLCHVSKPKEHCVIVEVIEISDNEENQESKDKIGVDKYEKKLRQVMKIAEKRKKQICRRQKKECQELDKKWKEKRGKLEEEHAAEWAVFRAIHRPSGTKMRKFLEEYDKFCQAIQDVICSNEWERRALEKKHADEMEEENRQCKRCLARAEEKYGRGGCTRINGANPHELESGNDAKNSGSSLSAPSSIIAADALVLDISGNREIEVVDNEPVHMQEVIPLSDEPATTNVSLRNSNDLAAAKVDNNVQIVTEIPSTNKDTETDLLILESHVDPLPENEPSTVGKDLANFRKPVDLQTVIANDNGNTMVSPYEHGDSAGFHNQPVALNEGHTMLHDSVDSSIQTSYVGKDLADDHPKLKELENKQHAAEVEEENRKYENWLAEAEKEYGGGQSSTINKGDTHGFETSNDRQFSPTIRTTTRVLEISPHSTTTSDLVVSDVSANGETELMTMQVCVQVSSEQFETAKISSQNPKDVSATEATSNGHIVDEIQSTNRDTDADSELPENHGGSLPLDGLLIGGMELTDDLLMLLNDDLLCQNPVASSNECDDPLVSVNNPGLEAASLSDCQVDREQSDLRTNIMDSADGGNRFESHASEGPGDMPHEQLGLGNADDVTNTAGSHNHTLSEVAGNAAEFQNGDVLPVVQLNGAASQNPASRYRAPTIAVETQHRPVLHPGPSSVELPQLQAARNQRLPMLTDPLQGEIDKTWKDTEQMIKMHEDAKLHLRAECEKEITEITTQIRNKYAEEVKDAESSYLAKRTEIEASQSKVFMNLLLADAFRSKCLDFRPSRAPVAYPGMPSVSLQQHTQLVP